MPVGESLGHRQASWQISLRKPALLSPGQVYFSLIEIFDFSLLSLLEVINSATRRAFICERAPGLLPVQDGNKWGISALVLYTMLLLFISRC